MDWLWNHAGDIAKFHRSLQVYIIQKPNPWPIIGRLFSFEYFRFSSQNHTSKSCCTVLHSKLHWLNQIHTYIIKALNFYAVSNDVWYKPKQIFGKVASLKAHLLCDRFWRQPRTIFETKSLRYSWLDHLKDQQAWQTMVKLNQIEAFDDFFVFHLTNTSVA